MWALRSCHERNSWSLYAFAQILNIFRNKTPLPFILDERSMIRRVCDNVHCTAVRIQRTMTDCVCKCQDRRIARAIYEPLYNINWWALQSCMRASAYVVGWQRTGSWRDQAQFILSRCAKVTTSQLAICKLMACLVLTIMRPRRHKKKALRKNKSKVSYFPFP